MDQPEGKEVSKDRIRQRERHAGASSLCCPYFARADALAACTSAPVKRSTFLSATNKLIASFNSC
jgi:hypothetical protein